MRLIQFFSIWSVNSLFLLSVAQASPFHDWSLNLIKSKKLNPDHFSFFLALDETKPILSHRSNQLMLPASITKLATASAVLDFLPPGTKFKTQLASSAKIEGDRLKGDLFLVGGGDPSFVSENMWYLVNQFVRTGIKVVEGSIVVDDSLFDTVRFDSSRESVRVDRAYDAPVGAMSFNWNSVNVYVRPGSSESANVILDPESDYYTLINQVKTVAGSGLSIDVDRSWDPKSKKEIFKVRGKIGKNVKEHVVFANINHPDMWSGHNLKSFLSQRGIQVMGDIKVGSSLSAQVLAEAESKPIELILADMNKFSNNYVAEMLTKQMALKKSSKGTMSGGMTAILEHLKSLKLSSDEFKIVNPSGLTRENRMSAHALWQLLDHHKHQFSTQPEMLSSLPIGGVDGTLKRRFKDSTMLRRVRAKTGLLNGVVSLAGYIDGKNDPSAFVFIYNGPGDAGRVRDVVDEILKKYYLQR